MIDKLKEFIRLADQTQAIVRSELSWEEKFHLIFSDAISSKLYETGLVEDYCDLDSSYEDDVRAFSSKISEQASRFKELLSKLDAQDGQEEDSP